MVATTTEMVTIEFVGYTLDEIPADFPVRAMKLQREMAENPPEDDTWKEMEVTLPEPQLDENAEATGPVPSWRQRAAKLAAHCYTHAVAEPTIAVAEVLFGHCPERLGLLVYGRDSAAGKPVESRAWAAVHGLSHLLLAVFPDDEGVPEWVRSLHNRAALAAHPEAHPLVVLRDMLETCSRVMALDNSQLAERLIGLKDHAFDHEAAAIVWLVTQRLRARGWMKETPASETAGVQAPPTPPTAEDVTEYCPTPSASEFAELMKRLDAADVQVKEEKDETKAGVPGDGDTTGPSA